MPMKKAKSKRLTIAVDVDDVLVPTKDAMRTFVNENFGTNHSLEDYEKPGEYRRYFEQVWQIGHEEGEKRYKAFVESGALLRAEPVEGAIKVITELEKSYELVIVSARADAQIEITHKWLLDHFPGVFKDVLFQSAWYEDKSMTKAAICKEIGASYLVDDNVEHCQTAQQEGITALLFGEYGWSKDNKETESLIRVKNWDEVRKYFEQIR